MKKVAEKSRNNDAQSVISAPNNLFRKKCDDILAAKKPILSFQDLNSQGE
jgi:hypothetical protein